MYGIVMSFVLAAMWFLIAIVAAEQNGQIVGTVIGCFFVGVGLICTTIVERTKS